MTADEEENHDIPTPIDPKSKTVEVDADGKVLMQTRYYVPATVPFNFWSSC